MSPVSSETGLMLSFTVHGFRRSENQIVDILAHTVPSFTAQHILSYAWCTAAMTVFYRQTTKLPQRASTSRPSACQA